MIGLRSQEAGDSPFSSRRTQISGCLPVGVIVVERTGRIELLNQAAREMLGLGKQSLEAHSVRDLWNDLGLPVVPFSNWEHKGRVLASWEQALGDPGKSPRWRVLLFKDITSEACLRDRLARQDRLARMGEKIGRIVHEIRNPLGSIELFATLLGEGTQDEAERRSLSGHLSTSICLLEQLLSNLLVSSKPDQLTIKNVHLVSLWDKVELLSQQHLRNRRIMLKRTIEPEAEWIQADETLTRQACLNILLNAIQASPVGGIIEIRCRRITNHAAFQESATKREMMILSVQDHGCGIESEDLSKVLDPFFSKREGGTGLGLSIVHQVMDAHRGDVTVESQQGKGTTVALCFPQNRRPI